MHTDISIKFRVFDIFRKGINQSLFHLLFHLQGHAFIMCKEYLAIIIFQFSYFSIFTQIIIFIWFKRTMPFYCVYRKKYFALSLPKSSNKSAKSSSSKCELTFISTDLSIFPFMMNEEGCLGFIQ